MSGVSRLRASKKNHSLKIETSGGEHRDSVGQPKVDVDDHLDAPKKYRPFETTTGQMPRFTKPPMSAEEPVRGEHGRNTSKTTRKD